mgnify:CR=1 FL=1
MKVLILDNYDSFTYNLFHIVEQFCNNVSVIRNDKIDFSIIDRYDKIILSPGPGLPNDAVSLKELIKKKSSSKTILGVCLGHQALGQVFGLNLINIKNVKHGEKSVLSEVNKEEVLFQGLNEPIEVGHYHSWVIDEKNNFKDWTVTAKSDDLIMAISHNTLNLKGVQFHPESVLTPLGKNMLENWIKS